MSHRTDRSREAILRATMALLDDDVTTLRDLTIERVARDAQVSKTTVYRSWPNKTALVIDTLLSHDIWRLPLREDVPAIDALRDHLAALASLYSGRGGRLVAQLIAECQYEPEARDELKRRFWNERSDAIARLLERAIRERSLRPHLDVATFAEQLYAPIYFRLLLQTGSLDREFTDGLLNGALDGGRRAGSEPTA